MLEFSFNGKWFFGTHVHFIINVKCARSIWENGRGAGRTYFADKIGFPEFIGETFS